MHDPLQPGKYYHIYNRGINSCNLFEKEEDYLHFLKLYGKYILPLAATIAYVLMRNHFHVMVQLKEGIVYKTAPAVQPDDNKWETVYQSSSPITHTGEETAAGVKTPNASNHFSHLFNAYSKYYNTKYHRHGALFERPFRRKVIDSDAYHRNMILYIHQNPVHHGFCRHPLEYGWSSYLAYVTEKPSKLDRDKCLRCFNSLDHFVESHNQTLDTGEIDGWMGL